MARKDPDIREDVSRSGGEDPQAGETKPETEQARGGLGREFTNVKNASASGLGSLEKSDESQIDAPPGQSGLVKD